WRRSGTRSRSRWARRSRRPSTGRGPPSPERTRSSDDEIGPVGSRAARARPGGRASPRPPADPMNREALATRPLAAAEPVPAPRTARGERGFRYFLVAPSIAVLLLIGLFPFVYLLVVSFQGITMTETDTGFVGLRNYAMLFHDARLWQALLHTVIF